VTWDLHETQKQSDDSVPKTAPPPQQQAPPPPPPPVCVMFSSMEQSERERCARLVQQLGATASSTPHYDADATHIVVGRPVRVFHHNRQVNRKWINSVVLNSLVAVTLIGVVTHKSRCGCW